MNQLALDYDDRMSGNHRRTDPVSSVVAARTCDADAQRGRILALLAERGPMYSAQIGRELEIPTAQVNSRLAAMAGRQMVERLDEMGENDRGQPVLLWEVTRMSRIGKVELFLDPTARPKWTGGQALVPLPKDECPDCAGPLVESSFGQLPLLRHGGYGAEMSTTFASCSECSYIIVRSRSETNPRRPAGSRIV